jgi:hypothetical protein
VSKKKPASKGGGARRATAAATHKSDRTAVKRNLGAVQSLPDFLATAGELSLDDRRQLINQALVMIEQVYVHLPLKRAMHAIDPVQQLRLLLLRVASLSERAFQDEMIAIYTHLRDLHTNYILPDPYRSRVAFLPFRIEEYFEGKERRYVVTQVSPLNTDPNLKPGVIPIHWNGIPIDRAVEINAEREAGSNLDARHAQGLTSLTNRWMGMSLPPDEEWVVLRYRDGNTVREGRFDWQVLEPDAPASGIDPLGAQGETAAGLGLDAKTEIQRRVQKLVFSAAAMQAERQMAHMLGALGLAAGLAAPLVAGGIRAFMDSFVGDRVGALIHGAAEALSHRAAEAHERAEALVRAARRAGADLSTQSVLPDVFPRFQAVTASQSGKQYGYVRLVTFSVNDVGEFLDEFIRILGTLPQGGLILDVRGNGGGVIAAGEMLLQLLTPRPIEPASFSLISSPLTLRLADKVSFLNPWKESIKQSVQTAAAYSQGFPLTSPELCNSIGQKYRGPVVLVTDALCYSTTDIFAAGFQDHGIGKILGVAERTGAGGANVWTHDFLREVFQVPGSPFKAVAGNASFRVAFRRSVRAGQRAGVPLEDLGVEADELHFMTRDDVLKGNVDLIQHAASLLDGMTAYTLDAEVADGKDSSARVVTATTANLDRVDVLVNGRPRLSLDVTDGPHTFTLPATGGVAVLELRGFRNNALAASTRLPLAAPAPRPSGSVPVPTSAAPSVSIQALMAIPAADRDLDWLKESLREAIRLEFSTIPPYLCGMWSVKEEGDPVYGVIDDVVLQEMLHMGLTCNLLAGLGETPAINSKAFVPDYPCELPGGVHPGLIVSLVGLSIPLVRDIWMQIERPLEPVPVGAAMVQTYQTIGQFYDALLDCFKKVKPPLDATRQLEKTAVELYKITDLDGVTRAITQIKEQGEGTTQSAFATDFGGDLAHYYRFQQIVEQKLIVSGPGGKAVWGDPLPFPEVFKMAEVPKGGWADQEVSRPFNRRFTVMLGLLQDAWAAGGAAGKAKLTQAVSVMRELTPLAQALMLKPLPQGNGFYGPSFQYDPAR